MATEQVLSIAIVHARQDDEVVDPLVESLRSEGVVVRCRRLMGLPGKTVAEDADTELQAAIIVVVWSAWLRSSDWAFSAEARRLLEDHELQTILVQPLGEQGRGLVANYGASPLARAETLAGLKPDGSNLVQLVRTLKRRLEKPPKRVRRADPGLGAAVADQNDARLTERLEGLFTLERHDPKTRGLKPQIQRTLEAFRERPRPRPGDHLDDGNYWLLELAGNGPVAGVWKAWDRASDRLVAVRVLHAQWSADEARVARFFAAARALGSLPYSGIAPLHDAGGIDQGFPYFVRDWYALGGLDQALEHGTVERSDALQAVLDVSTALIKVHDADRVHGNLKPANILLDSDRRAFLSDFSGDPIDRGDPVYVAPEVQDDASELTPATDVYGLAMCMVFALHGSPLPFWVLRNPAELVNALTLPSDDGEVVLPSSAKRALLAGLEWSLERRTASVRAFLDGFFETVEVIDVVRANAERRGRHDAAAEHIQALLRRSEERPLELVAALGKTWAAAARAGHPEAVESTRALMLEVLERATEEKVVDEVVEVLRGLCADDMEGAAALADMLHDLQGTPLVSVCCTVHAARIRGEVLNDPSLAAATWSEVLEEHRHWDQAAEAYTRLIEVSRGDADRQAFFDIGSHAIHYLPETERSELAYALGRVAQDDLQDMPQALRWLERAQELGCEDDDIPRRLESIRSARGEWRQVVALMLERAEGLAEAASIELLIRAARVAVHAHNHHDDAAAILLRVLLLNPEQREALRFLARYHARAGRDERALALYARLAPHEERSREGETVATRVADNVDYARVLLRCDRPRGAQLCLEAALDLNPAHVPTLSLTSQLSYDLGKWEEARVANQGLVSAFGSATNDPVLLGARLRLGEIAWLHGDLLLAIEHYNAALEMDPSDARVWWGKAKVALAGIHGRLNAEAKAEEPWMLAAPVKFTPQEALARLLHVLVRHEAAEPWMKLDPMGRELAVLLEGQQSRVVVCAMVDLLVARGLVTVELFERLSKEHGGWRDAIESVRMLWFDENSARGFGVIATYGWEEESGADFDPTHHREAMAAPPLEQISTRASLAALSESSAWKLLFHDAAQCRTRPPASPGPVVPSALARVGLFEMFPDSPDRRAIRVDQSITVGSGVHDDLSAVAPGLRPAHVRFRRVADAFYLEAQGPVKVDGRAVRELRLVGGERLSIGAAEACFHLLAPGEEVPSWSPVQRPEIGSKPTGHPLVERVERAALFYREGGSDRIVPLATETLVLWEDEAGELRSRAGRPSTDDYGLISEGGTYWFHEPDAEPRRLDHQNEIVIGRRVLQFKELSRGSAAPLADIAALWGAPEGAPILVYDDGSRHGRPLVLDRPAYRVGRGRQADFQISFDTSLSRVHCIFFVRGDVVAVRDAGSANGTTVNGEPTGAEVILQDGDSIEVGQSRFHFRLAPSGDEVTIEDDLEDFGSDEATEVLPVSERVRSPLALDEGLEKIRVTNRVLKILLGALDDATEEGRGQELLENMVAARPRSYHDLLDGVDVRGNSLPGLEVMFNVAQRPDAEQRPLVNHVLQHVIERVIESVCIEIPDSRVGPVLLEVSDTRYREVLRI